MQNDALPLKLAVDNTRRRRQVALPESTIARAIRAARKHGGPNWRVMIDGNVTHIFEGEAPALASAPSVAPTPVARGIGIVT